MNKTAGIIIGAIALVVVASVAYGSLNKGADSMMEKDAVVTDEQMKKDVMMKDEAMPKDDTAMVDNGEKMMKSGSYEAYSPEKLARAETGDVVLFFHASWCPTCRGLNADIEKNLSAIPSEVSILKIDYDTATELKKKYGVTYQHTLVQVAADGTLIKKWSGSPTLASLAAQIQ